MSLNLTRTRQLLQDFEFGLLFVEELGWSPPANRHPVVAKAGDVAYTRAAIAELAGIGVFSIITQSGSIPDAKARIAIQQQVAENCYENLLIFTDTARTQSLWYWVKRESGKEHPRDHLYVKGQPGDLFISKLAAMVVDISELDTQGNIALAEVAGRLKKALDVERVTKKFYGEFDIQRLEFTELIRGIKDDHQRRWYASVLMNRLMFIWFLQKKFFLDGRNVNYLTDKLDFSRRKLGADKFFPVFLNALFFEGFAKPEPARSAGDRALLGKIRYLNGGLFLPHRVELDHGFPDKPRILIPDRAFENVFNLFGRYSWNLDDTPAGKADEINPDVLGYIFEKYINQKEFGAYYTRPEMTGYLCERTIFKLVLDRVNQAAAADVSRRTTTSCAQNPPPHVGGYNSISDLLLNLDAKICRVLVFEILPALRLLDPACGSGAFLVAAMKVLINIYSAILGKVELEYLRDPALKKWHDEVHGQHRAPAYYIKKRIITENLFGVDIMEEATEIARLRLFLALVASAQTEDQLEPLPNIDFNILAGNSLIGLLHVDPKKFDAGQNKSGGSQDRLTLQHGSDLGFTVETKTAPTKVEKTAAFVAQQNAARFAAIQKDKNKSIELYRKHAFQPGEIDGLTQEERLIALRSHIENVREQSYARLNQMLLDEFNALGIKFEEATWDEMKNTEGKPIKRLLKLADMKALQPFHWGYEFDKVLAEGGFDGLITNPPWETFQPDAKEFFAEYSELVTKKKMDIKEFQKELKRLLRDPEVMEAWLDYHSRFNHQRNFFRFAPQYANQVPIIDGKRHGKDVNLFKLFVEQAVHLLRPGGQCGIVIPSGIYTDLGAKSLREMLFSKTQIESLFCFENRKEIFEGVHRSFKFVVLTFQNGGQTKEFPAAFMRHDVAELIRFPQEGALNIKVDLVKRLSPGSLSVMEFKSENDIRIAEKMLNHPLLGDESATGWRLELHREFNMTDDANLFKEEAASGRLPLYEGKMIWHFDCKYSEPRYWINEKEGRKALLGRESETGRELDYQTNRLAYRDVTGSTNERTLVSTVLPPRCFTGNTLVNSTSPKNPSELLFISAVMNSFAVDYIIRQKVTNHCNMFYVYQLPVPRLSAADATFGPIVKRAAQLICTTSEVDALAKEVGLGSHKKGVTAPDARAKLRAELDGLIAHLYGLTEAEFTHILTAFPLVAQPVKDAALEAYRAVAKGGLK